MKRRFGGFALTVAAAVLAARAEGFVLAQRGTAAGCGIVTAANADETVRYAARELRDFTKRMTGVELPIIDAVCLTSLPPRAIMLGVADGLPPDGFRLKARAGHLHVTGGGPRGVLYGVYELLERFGGCAWFTPWCESIPERESFTVPDELDLSDRPAFEQRETSWRHNIVGNDRYAKKFGNAAFAARMRFNGQWHRDPLYGGTAMPFAKRLGICHTFYTLVPPKTHFAAHPEWFSEIDGRRTGERAQLCWSNRELVAFVAEEIKRRLRAEPGARMVGVSQNDWRGYCQCAECASLTRAEGSPAGPNLKFANAIAEEVGKEFPDVLIETLAYQFTRKPPKTIRPRRNVAVCLCSFECSFSVPFAESNHANTKGFCEDLRGWGKICRNLFIYNYATNFRNYLFPFPNIYSMAPNYKLFLENGARWIYDQADGNGYHGEFAELKCYLQSKLMWNPNRDIEPLIDRFMAAYYGAAAPLVRRYFDELYASFNIRNEHNPDPDAEPSNAGIYGENLPQLTEEKLDRWTALWREAESAVKEDAQRAYNVRMSALPVLYVRLKRLYERGYKTVWAAENPAPHCAGMAAIKPLAAELVACQDEATAAKRRFSLAENYKTRHVVLMEHFRALAEWASPVRQGRARAEIGTNQLEYIASERLWQIPIRLFACDAGAKYRVRAHLRTKKPTEPRLGGVEDGYDFAAGLRVRWLPHAAGRQRTEFPRGTVSPDWAWHDLGEFDFSELQKIPLPTMDGLVLFVQGDVELDRIEIVRESPVFSIADTPAGPRLAVDGVVQTAVAALPDPFVAPTNYSAAGCAKAMRFSMRRRSSRV